MRADSCFLIASVLVLMSIGMAHEANATDKQQGPKRLKDCLWVWGNPEMTTEGEHTVATFAQASPAERVKLLGVSNIMMAGHGLPNDDAKAEALTKQVAHCPRILWEILADGDGGPPFVYKQAYRAGPSPSQEVSANRRRDTRRHE